MIKKLFIAMLAATVMYAQLGLFGVQPLAGSHSWDRAAGPDYYATWRAPIEGSICFYGYGCIDERPVLIQVYEGLTS